jgi:hypothetical protein
VVILLIARLDATWTEVLTGRAPFFELLWKILVRFILPLAVAILIHECGHLIAGLAMGYRFFSIRVGPVKLKESFRVSIGQGRRGAWGSTVMAPMVLKAARVRHSVYSLAGPAANLITTLVVIKYSSPSPFSDILAMISAFLGITNLIPFGRSVPSDGKRIIKALFRGQEIKRWAAMGQMLSAMRRGDDPEQMPQEVVTALVGVRDASSATVVAHLLAHVASWESGPDDETARRIEVALQFLSHVRTEWREFVCGAAGLFQANKRKNVELAREWLTELPEKPLHPSLRLRIEAAILETQGEFAAAMDKINEIETDLAKTVSPQNEHAIKNLQRWRSEIENKAKGSESAAVTT